MILYFDTETTGIHPGQICQLSYIMQDKDKVNSKNFFFSVDYVEQGAYAVHGFSVGKLKVLSKGLKFKDFASEIIDDFESARLVVAHNLSFDLMFLRKEFERINKIVYLKEGFCSMKGTTALCKLKKSNGLGYKYPKLSELCQFLQISNMEIKQKTQELFGEITDFHDARFDTTAVYLAICKGMQSCELLANLKEML